MNKTSVHMIRRIPNQTCRTSMSTIEIELDNVEVSVTDDCPSFWHSVGLATGSASLQNLCWFRMWRLHLPLRVLCSGNKICLGAWFELKKVGKDQASKPKTRPAAEIKQRLRIGRRYKMESPVSKDLVSTVHPHMQRLLALSSGNDWFR